MYRCAACDAPALMNCECHTQLEGICTLGGTIITNPEMLPVPVRTPEEQKKALADAGNRVVELTAWRKRKTMAEKLNESISVAKQNISSGEDAMTPQFVVEVVDDYS